MIWYAATPARRLRQVFADLLVVGWVVGCLVAGGLVHTSIGQLARPARALQDAARQSGTGLADARGRIGEVPLVGERLRDAMTPLTSATGDVGRAAADFATGVEQLARTAGLLTALLPAAAVVAPWLWRRLRFRRRAAEAVALLEQSNGSDLLAVRALAHRSLAQLMGVDPDPAGAWRRRDPDVVRGLAALELRACGVHPGRIPTRG